MPCDAAQALHDEHPVLYPSVRRWLRVKYHGGQLDTPEDELQYARPKPGDWIMLKILEKGGPAVAWAP